jgi:hypothetical protein
MAQRREVIAEQFDQGVGDTDGPAPVEAALRGIAGEQRRRPGIGCIAYGACQFENIAQGQVEPLAGYGMQRLGRVAEPDLARGNRTAAVAQPEREYLARADTR